MPYPDSTWEQQWREARRKTGSSAGFCTAIEAANALLATLRHASDALDYAQAQVSSDSDRQRLLLWLRDVNGVIAKAEGRE
jgi:hypothetical protein